MINKGGRNLKVEEEGKEGKRWRGRRVESIQMIKEREKEGVENKNGLGTIGNLKSGRHIK